MNKANPQVKKGIIEAIEKQISTNNPPEAAEAYERLLGEGHTRENALIYLGQALAAEMFHMMKHETEFDPKRYAETLAKAPNLD